MRKTGSTVLFASAVPDKMDRDQTLPARFKRLLDRLPIRKRVKGKTVAIKMHFGGGLGYSTIHPLFVKLLVDHVKAGKPKRVFVTDGTTDGAGDRGYAKETLGAELVPAFGKNGKSVYRRETGWDKVKAVLVSKPIFDADVLINFSHVKGHGDCGFGGACKNLGMGCIPWMSRKDIHELEGGLTWDKTRCTHCKKCIKECDMKANSFNDKGEYSIFWHHCKMCRHCMLACPTKAIVITKPEYDLFQDGLARVSKLVIDNFREEHVFHINMLTQITMFCDCWGLTTPSLVPDVGIIAGDNITAVDCASLDAIKVENLIPGSITPPFKLGKGGHLFQRILSRDPFAQLCSLEKIGAGSRRYRIEIVK